MVGSDVRSEVVIRGAAVLDVVTVVVGGWELVVVIVSVVSTGIDVAVGGRIVVVEGDLEIVVGSEGGVVNLAIEKLRSTHVAVREDCTLCLSQFLRSLEIAY